MSTNTMAPSSRGMALLGRALTAPTVGSLRASISTLTPRKIAMKDDALKSLYDEVGRHPREDC